MDEDLTRAYDQINDLSDELEDLEADLYEDDEDDDGARRRGMRTTEEDDNANDDDIASEPFYEVACPNCGETVYVSEDDLDAGEANCAHCGVTFEVALEDERRGAGGRWPRAVRGDLPRLWSRPLCLRRTTCWMAHPSARGCGKPLDFEVTEE